jgi:hypothetical protein
MVTLSCVWVLLFYNQTRFLAKIAGHAALLMGATQRVNETAWELTDFQQASMPKEIAKVLEDGGAWVNCDGLTNPNLFKGTSGRPARGTLRAVCIVRGSSLHIFCKSGLLVCCC